MISYMIPPLPSTSYHAVALAGADISPVIRTDYDSDSDRIMDSDEELDFADQGPPSDFESEEDTQILATLLKNIPACIDAADIELLLQDIPVQPRVVIPARTMQEAVQAKDLPPLDVDAANVFSQSERILQEHVCRHNIDATELKDLIQRVLHHPDFNADEIEHDMQQRLMQAVGGRRRTSRPLSVLQYPVP
jgi:hypothetical protein